MVRFFYMVPEYAFMALFIAAAAHKKVPDGTLILAIYVRGPAPVNVYLSLPRYTSSLMRIMEYSISIKGALTPCFFASRLI